MRNSSTILIVDDEPIGRDTLQAILFAEGYDLAFASNGLEALDKAAKLTPDLILLDVMMPGMDGHEVCRRLRADPLLAKVPIIMVTALDDRQSRLQGIEAGADDFVTKPFDHVELRTRVQTTTQINRYRTLLLERAKFEWVVEQVDDGYLTINDDDQVLYANPQARLYLDLPLAGREPRSETFLELARRHYRCESQEAWTGWPALSEDSWQRTPNTLQPPRYLVRPATSAAETAVLQVDIIEMAPSAREIERYLVRLRDVTESVAKQRLVWAFHTQIRHKLRSPLSLLTASLEFLDMLLHADHVAPLDEEHASLLERVHKSTTQLQDEIQRILQYVEVPELAKRRQSRYCLAEVPPLVAEIKTSLALDDIRIRHSGIPDLAKVQVRISRWAMELILWELAANAKKFHPEGMPALELAISKTSDVIVLRVSDDGMALSPNQLSRIWIPYFQAEKRFTGQVPGMGLGLSMIASLIWDVGGTCHAFNRADRPGLTIELGLPVCEATAAELDGTQPKAQHRRGEA
jgi:DNA-binding response OmpR family regulator